MLSRERIVDLLQRVQGLRVGVAGDFCLDRYGAGHVEGQSRETGRSIVRITEHLFCPGGAANVAWNVAALGAKCAALTVIGADAFGEMLRNALRERGVDTGPMVLDPTRLTPSFEKIKVHDGDRTREDRWDVVNRRPIPSEAERRYINALESAAAELDCLIVADYDEAGSGIITPRALERIREIGRRSRLRVLATSRQRIGAFCPSVAVVNEYEAVVAHGVAGANPFEAADAALLDEAGASLARKNGRTAFVTLGKAGIAVFEPDGRRERAPTVEARGEIDIVGAGDTALAAIAVFLCAGTTPVEAAMLGNIAANVTVRKVGITGAASPQEILQSYDTFFSGQV